MLAFLIPGIAFIAAAALGAWFIMYTRESGISAAEERLEIFLGKKARNTGDPTSQTQQSIVREGIEGFGGVIGKLLAKFSNFQAIFDQADSPIKPDIFLLISAGTGAVSGLIAFLARSPMPLIPVAALVGALLPLGWLLWRRSSRLGKFASQLPDALELIGRALRSGHSLASGLHVVVEEMPSPISTEFGMAYEEQNLGVPIEQALKGMLKRVPNMDLKFFVTAVAIQRQAGGDLSEILDKIGYLIRERFKILGQVQALTGEGRISGVVLMALPIALFFAVYHLNPDYVMLLFEDELGRKMIAVAIVLQILGAIAIKKIVTIKV